MAYSKTPTMDTYSQEEIHLARTITSRQNDPLGLKDEIYINAITEVVKNRPINDNRLFAYSRGGSSQFIAGTNGQTIRGSYFWKEYNLFCYAIDTTLYMYNVTTGVTTTVAANYNTGTSDVGFTTFLTNTGSVWLITTDGTKLTQVTDAGVSTTCVSANLPSPHLPYPVFLDGYLVLAKANSGDVWNSDLNNPMTWTAGNFFTAEIEGDFVYAIEKLNNYIVVFGSTTIEYFWDAGNATGSPFQRNETPVKITGFLGGITKVGRVIYFLGYDKNDSIELFKLQDFSIEGIATPTVKRYLNSIGLTSYPIFGYSVVSNGHTFYCVIAGPRTFVYDVDEHFWSKWAWQQTNTFPLTSAKTFTSSSGTKTVFSLSGSSTLYLLDDSVYQDIGVNFTTTFITEQADFGTMNRKSMGKLTIVCDRPSVNSVVSVYVTDDDFQTWQYLGDTNLNQDIPCIYRCGNFRQRAVKIVHTDNVPIRLQKLEANINKGMT